MDGFTRLASGGCPPIADLMLALAAEFRDVDADAVDARLDELALPLFGLAGGDLRVAAARLADILDTDPGFDADRSSVAALWLDSALEARAGHPLMLAALVAEVGRRAGLDVHVLSAPTGWYAGLGDGERLWLVDATMDGRTADPWSLRRHCTARARLRRPARPLRPLRAPRRHPPRRPRRPPAQPPPPERQLERLAVQLALRIGAASSVTSRRSRADA